MLSILTDQVHFTCTSVCPKMWSVQKTTHFVQAVVSSTVLSLLYNDIWYTVFYFPRVLISCIIFYLAQVMFLHCPRTHCLVRISQHGWQLVAILHFSGLIKQNDNDCAGAINSIASHSIIILTVFFICFNGYFLGKPELVSPPPVFSSTCSRKASLWVNGTGFSRAIYPSCHPTNQQCLSELSKV